jgi:hypothetical protein
MLILTCVQNLDMVDEFTSWRPHLNPTGLPHSVAYGEWPKQASTGEVHLFFDLTHILVVFGGMVWNEERTELADTPWIHQICHKDFEHEHGYFQEMTDNPTLCGLTKPGAINIPLEDYRDIYVNNVNNVTRTYLGQQNYIPGNTPHGGINFVCEIDKGTVRYHPCLHVVLESFRHGYKADTVSLCLSSDTYLHEKHVPLVSDKELADELERTERRMKLLHRFASTGNRKLRKSAKLIVDSFNPIFDGDEVDEAVDEEVEEDNKQTSMQWPSTLPPPAKPEATETKNVSTPCS